ncbi:hypothetical protein [Streptomyces sp900116325]|uniref:hypothetical protein n=1 Tax=Streptomyces sp. 900116325 TaxID=3154295 RepID=UPI0033E1E44D
MPDGTPIAVVAERDCAGVVQQTGWLNLSTGAYTTGVPPAAAAACGDSRSIQVSGILCDVAPDGAVFGLVLTEYHYADDGSIDSVRLVDAATGATYTLQGQLTVCPSGGDDDESPGEAPAARQVVERCGCDDTDGDGIGDIRYVELWSVDTTGLSPAFLIGTYIDGDFDQPYTPVNPVDCQDAGGDESPGEPTQTCAPQIVERCGCDDSDGDGIGDVRYTELWAIDPCGGDAPALLGAWVDGDFDQPYTPVAPVDCIGGDESPGELAAGFEVAPVPLCVIDDATGGVLQNVLAEVIYDQTTGERTGVRYVDQVTGAPVPLPGGSHLALCPVAESCNDCTALVLCDVDAASPSTIAGTPASGRLANGVEWSAAGGAAAFPPSRQSDDAAWWGIALFPNAVTSPVTWTFDQAVTVDFSVVMAWLADGAPGQNTAQLPLGAVPLSLPSGYSYDRDTGIVSIDSTVTGCAPRTPTREDGARFRMVGVTSVSVRYLGTRALLTECQSFGNYAFGAVDVSLGGQFLRTVCRDCDGTVTTVTDTMLDGTTPYTPVGEVGVCMPATPDEPCPSTVQVLRLCDLNPDVDPDPDGNRCATPFLRHLIYDCTGAVTSTQDTAMDGVTAYTPVQVVDCGTGGVPALFELDWPQAGIVEDPALPGGQDFIYTLTNPDKGDAATIHLHASRAAGGGCGAYDPTNPVFNNPTAYTLNLSPEAQAMTRFRLDFNDLDNFEGINALTPRPDSVVFDNGTGTYDPAAGTIRTNESANPGPTVYAYWNTPPSTITWGYANNGGGTACCQVAFRGTTLKPGGCCSGCDGTSDGESPGGLCRDVSSTLLCDVAATDTLTVFDPLNVPGPDGWQVTSFTGFQADAPPQAAMPYDAAHPTGNLSAYMGARDDLSAGTSTGPWTDYDAAPIQWVITKTFTAPQDSMAVVQATGFRADGGARVRINGQDVGLYGQYNQPAVGGSAQVPVTAGPNVIEIEVHDVGGPNTVQGRLDVTMTQTVQFFRKQVTDCETGDVLSTVDTTLDGQPYTVTGTVGQCEQVQECCPPPPPETRVDVESDVMCLTAADGTLLGQVLVERVYDDQSGDRLSQRLVDPTTGDEITPPDGATLGLCGGLGDESPGELEPCRNSTALLVCDLPEDGEPAPTVTDTDPTPYYSDPVAVPVAGAQSLWSGGTLTLPPGTGPQPGTIGTVNTLAATATAARPACDDGTATVTASVLVGQTGPDSGCGPTGHLRLFNGAQQVALMVLPAGTPVGWLGTLTVTAQVPAADLAAGNVAVVLALDAYDGGLTCTPNPRVTGWNLSQFTAAAVYDQTTCAQQVLASVVTDCESGQVESVTYTTMDGTPYTPTGQIGQCQPAGSPTVPEQPCGDTELAQLCDLTYDPQAPIPTPAGDFTLTGNVLVPSDGASLWFAQANQPANGMAELTVSGLLPSVMYEFHFESAFVGSGAPDPANNNAIYLLDILDGTNVIATRTRNISNGSNAYPGSALAEDVPPLAFITPATGAVTIRFTDQTTGGAVNDRDLLIRPLDVRTASLTVTATPFLRRFTFDCDGGLTSTQDLGLDGVTPYVVQGEASSCASSGDGSAVAAPNGDVVDCEDGSRALLVKVCGAGEESPGESAPCRDSTTMLVCDIPASTTTEVDADLTDSTGAAAAVPAGWGGIDLAGPYTALWSGGTLNIPATAGPAAQTTAVVGVLTADAPTGCDAATGTLTVSARVTNQGPDSGQAWDGTLQLRKAGTVLADAPFPSSALAGQSFVRTVSVPVTLADLASGDLYVVFGFETYHLGAKSWTAEELSAVVELEGCDATTATQILRTVVTDCETGEVVSTSDTTLDGAPYTVTGEVGQCVPADTPAACCPTGETLALCDVADDGTTTAFLRRLTYTPDSVTPAVFDTGLDGATPYTVAGTVGVCPGAPDEPVKVVEQCRCDQTADGVVEYVELIAVAEDGTLTTIGTYDEDFAPYTPVSPVACPVEGAPPAMGVQARRVELAPGGSWSAAGVTLLQSVTAVSHAGNGTVTTTDGDSTLHDGESVTWSVGRDTDAALTGPLTITAGTGTVTVAFTTAVTL